MSDLAELLARVRELVRLEQQRGRLLVDSDEYARVVAHPDVVAAWVEVARQMHESGYGEGWRIDIDHALNRLRDVLASKLDGREATDAP